MLMLANLAALDPRVCAPLVEGGAYVVDVDVDGTTMYGTLFELAEGEVPDDVNPTDAYLVGANLSKLHTSLQDLPEYEIPLVPALAPGGFEPGNAPLQLIHGDFGSQNLRKAAGASAFSTSMMPATERGSLMSPTVSTWCFSTP